MLRREGTLLKVNVCTCIVSAVFTLIGVFEFRSIFFVIGGVVIAIIGRSLWSENQLTRELGVTSDNAITVGELILTAVFASTAFLLPDLAALGCYCVAYSVFLIVCRKRVTELLSKIKCVANRK